MWESSRTLKPISSVLVEPNTLFDGVELTEKDKVIVDFFLMNINVPTHEGGIARGATIEDKSGRRLRGVTKKHVGDRCKRMQSIGILKYKLKRPLRGAGYKTRHYYLNDEVEAFRTLVHTYLCKEDPMRRLIFMHSLYLHCAVEENIKELLFRWLIPEEEDQLLGEPLFFVLGKRLQEAFSEPSEVPEEERRETDSTSDERSIDEDEERVERVLNALRSVSREGDDAEVLSFFEQRHAFTEAQVRTYEDIVRLSPTALHLLVFLPFQRLLEQYLEIGLVKTFGLYSAEPLRNQKQPREWWLTNRIIHELLHCAMMSDVIRFPFLMMRADKQYLLSGALWTSRRDGLLHDSLFSLSAKRRRTAKVGDDARRRTAKVGDGAREI